MHAPAEPTSATSNADAARRAQESRISRTVETANANLLASINFALGAMGLASMPLMSAEALREAAVEVEAAPQSPLSDGAWAALDTALVSIASFRSDISSATRETRAMQGELFALYEALQRHYYASDRDEREATVRAGGTTLNMEIGPLVEDHEVERTTSLIDRTNRVVGDGLPLPVELGVQLDRTTSQPRFDNDEDEPMLELAVETAIMGEARQMGDGAVVHEYGHAIFDNLLRELDPSGEHELPDTQWREAYDELVADVIAVLTMEDPQSVSSSLPRGLDYAALRDFSSPQSLGEMRASFGDAELESAHHVLTPLRNLVWRAYQRQLARGRDARSEIIAVVARACASEAWSTGNDLLSVDEVNERLIARLHGHALFSEP